MGNSTSQGGGKNNEADGKDSRKKYFVSLKIFQTTVSQLYSELHWESIFFCFNSLKHTLISGACQLKETSFKVGVGQTAVYIKSSIHH